MQRDNILRVERQSRDVRLGNSKNLALLSYITVCIVWGSTYLAIRVGVNDMPFMLFAGVRFTVAGLLIILCSRLKGWAFPPTRRDVGSTVLGGLLLLFVSNSLICWAEQWLDSGLTALLIAATPLFMAALEFFLPQAKGMGWPGWCGLAIGFGGVVLLIGPGFRLADNNHILPAMLAVLLAALCWAAGSIFLQRRPVGGDMMPAVGLQMLGAGVSFLLLALLTGNFSLAGASAKGFAALAYLIFFGSILAYSAYIYMIQAYPAAKAGTYAYINPIVAVLLGALILKEEVAPRTILASAVILGGVILVQAAKVTPGLARNRQAWPGDEPGRSG